MRHLQTLLILLLFSSPGLSVEPLVDGGWLKGHLNDKGLYILDIQPTESYRQYHVPGAINVPYALWRTDRWSVPPGMLPPLSRLEELLSGMGIRREHHVIVVTTGIHPSDMSAASRVFWTLTVAGHEKVSLLNGGLASYANRFAGTVETRANHIPATRYLMALNEDPIADAAAVKEALSKGIALLDARTLGEYMGVVTAKPNERAGTLPGAHHLPYEWLVGGGSQVRSKEDILTLFQKSGVDPQRDGTIHFCHTGNRAALNWFVDYAILENRKARLYDGSMSEWAQQSELPMEKKIDLSKDPGEDAPKTD